MKRNKDMDAVKLAFKIAKEKDNKAKLVVKKLKDLYLAERTKSYAV